jgi:hypothetical protein
MTNIKLPEKAADGEYYFDPDGNMRASVVETDANGNRKYKYWISGKLTNRNGSKIIYNNSDVLWIPVKERSANYDGKQQNKSE